MRVLQVGLIGYGLSGRYLQAPFFAAHPGFRVVSVVTSRSEELRERFANLRPTASAEEVFADPQVEVVVIATPNATHYALAHAALSAGKHVLVDKPACTSAAELRQLRDLALARSRHLFVFQNRRWDSDFLTVRKVLNSGDLGRLVAYEARYDRWKPAPNAKAWKETPGPGAGMLYDLGAHLIDQTIACFGVPNHVTGRSWTQRLHTTVPDAFDVHLAYDHFVADLSCSLLVREPTPRYRLHGDRGAFVKYGIDVQEDQLKLGLDPHDPAFGQEPAAQNGLLHTEKEDGQILRETYPTSKGNWMGLFNNLYQVVTSGAEPAVPLIDIIAQLEIIAAIEGEQ